MDPIRPISYQVTIRQLACDIGGAKEPDPGEDLPFWPIYYPTALKPPPFVNCWNYGIGYVTKRCFFVETTCLKQEFTDDRGEQLDLRSNHKGICFGFCECLEDVLYEPPWSLQNFRMTDASLYFLNSPCRIYFEQYGPKIDWKVLNPLKLNNSHTFPFNELLRHRHVTYA